MINLDTRLLDILSGDEIGLFVHILKRINKENKSFPSINLLQKETGFGREKVYSLISSLIDKKIISREKSRKKGQFDKIIYKILTKFAGVYISASGEELECHDTENHDTVKPDTAKQTLSINKDLSINQNKEYSEDLNSRIKFYNSIICHFPIRTIPKVSKDAEKWLDDIRLLIEKDNCSYEVLEKIITTFRNDDFWSSNFMSLLKLRKKNKTGIMYIDYFREKLKLNPTIKEIPKIKFRFKFKGTGHVFEGTESEFKAKYPTMIEHEDYECKRI